MCFSCKVRTFVIYRIRLIISFVKDRYDITKSDLRFKNGKNEKIIYICIWAWLKYQQIEYSLNVCQKLQISIYISLCGVMWYLDEDIDFIFKNIFAKTQKSRRSKIVIKNLSAMLPDVTISEKKKRGKTLYQILRLLTVLLKSYRGES